MKMSDLALIDTNVLVYATFPNSPFHEKSKAFCNLILAGKKNACLSLQVILEFIATITNSKRVDNPRSDAEALTEIQKYLSGSIPIIFPLPETLPLLMDLIKLTKCHAHDVFDLQLAATMLVNGVNKVYTYDSRVFSKIPDIEILAP